MKKLIKLLGLAVLPLFLLACSDVTPMPNNNTLAHSSSVSSQVQPTNVSPINLSKPTETPGSLTSPLASVTTASNTSLPIIENPLGAVPNNCPAGPVPQDIAPQYFAPVIGGPPVWLTGFSGPSAKLTFEDIKPSMLAKYGWRHKILWEVEKIYSEPVLIKGENIGDGTPLWFEPSGKNPSTTAFFDPDKPSTSDGPNWSGWPSYLYVAKAGCYRLEAQSNSGKSIWKINFAAGV